LNRRGRQARGGTPDAAIGVEAATSIGLYDDAAIYDLLYTPGTATEVDGLERLARRFIDRAQPHWLEPACGTGRYLRVLAARGHHVTGFDHKPGMLEYAQGRLQHSSARRRVHLFHADMERFSAAIEPGTIDIAFNLVNTIRHLESDAAVLRHLAEMARVLRPGGIYVIGISLSAYGSESPEEDVWEARRGRCRVRQVIQFLPPGTWIGSGRGERIERAVSHLMVERPSGQEHRDTTYPLRCYDAAQWRWLLTHSPLRPIGAANAAGRMMPRRPMPYALDVLDLGACEPHRSRSSSGACVSATSKSTAASCSPRWKTSPICHSVSCASGWVRTSSTPSS
jgi:SAM-dependent methyltransferase